jgi:dolichol-phosphate mannosyltransferase
MGLFRRNIGYIIRFGIVGLTGTLIHMLMLFILTEYAGIYYLYSAAFAFIFAVTSNFIFNKFWTFSKTSKGKNIKRYSIFFITAIIAFSVNITLLYIFTEFFLINYLLSQLIAIAFSFWINFIGSKMFAFRL